MVGGGERGEPLWEARVPTWRRLLASGRPPGASARVLHVQLARDTCSRPSSLNTGNHQRATVFRVLHKQPVMKTWPHWWEVAVARWPWGSRCQLGAWCTRPWPLDQEAMASRCERSAASCYLSGLHMLTTSRASVPSPASFRARLPCLTQAWNGLLSLFSFAGDRALQPFFSSVDGLPNAYNFLKLPKMDSSVKSLKGWWKPAHSVWEGGRLGRPVHLASGAQTSGHVKTGCSQDITNVSFLATLSCRVPLPFSVIFLEGLRLHTHPAHVRRKLGN